MELIFFLTISYERSDLESVGNFWEYINASWFFILGGSIIFWEKYLNFN